MSPELKLNRRQFLVLAAAVVAVKPLTNIDNTRRRVWGLLGHDIDCSGSGEIDTVAVLGGDGAEQGGRLTMGAGAYLSLPSARTVILLDGVSASGQDQFAQREFFKEEVARLSRGTRTIPDTAFLIDDRSTNTATNARELKKFVTANEIKRVGVVTSPDHMSRAMGFICAQNLEARPLVAANTTSSLEIFKQVISIWDSDGWLTTTFLKVFR